MSEHRRLVELACLGDGVVPQVAAAALEGLVQGWGQRDLFAG